MFMKTHYWLLLLLLPTLGLAQTERKGVYGSVSVGYGSYTLDLYEYHNGGSIYADQDFSGIAVALGVEKKSAWHVNKFVFDVGGELTGGFGIKTKVKATGNLTGESKGGYALGVSGLFKAGYLLSKKEGAVTPVIGAGPYFLYVRSGQDGNSNYIYGLQGFVGVDFRLPGFVLTPQMRFGLASWGSSDEMDQNGQPSMFEVGLKIAKKF